MTDSELPSKQYHQNRREQVSSPIPPLSHSSSLNDICNQQQEQQKEQQHQTRSPPPPAIKTRFPLANISDHIFKAARRLSMASTPKDYNPPPSPAPHHSGDISPDIKRGNRISAFIDDYTNSNNNINNNPKDKKKKPLVKMDLLNLKSKNVANSSQANLIASPITGEKSLPAPPPPGKETYWRGIARHNICTEDDYRLLLPQTAGPIVHSNSQQQQLHQEQKQQLQKQQSDHGSPSSQKDPPPFQQAQPQEGVAGEHAAARGVTLKFGSDLLVANGHTGMYEHDRDHNNIAKIYHGPQLRQQLHYRERYQRPTSPTPPKQRQQQLIFRQQSKSKDVISPIQQSNRLASTMSEDLSRLSMGDLHDGDSSISDHSLQMEDVFDVYDSYSVGSSADSSRQSSMRNPSRSFSDQTLTLISGEPQQQHLPYQLENKPLSALERIQQQQRRDSREQEQLADAIAPSKTGSGSGSGPDQNILPSRNFSRDILPTQSSASSSSAVATAAATEANPSQQQSGSAAAVDIAAVIDDSLMLDQLLTLAPGPNRPRLPSQIEWERGFEELRQRHKEAAGPTSSVGRQNSSSSRHSREPSDGKSRRHSMPDMPHGQTREDQERQRGDNFRNPMLIPGLGSGQRWSVYEDREQQLQQPPIQRQSIAECRASDPFSVPSLVGESRQMRNNKETNVIVDSNDSSGSTAIPVERMRDSEKDVVDIAFDEMLASLSLPVATRAQLESLPKERKWALLQTNDANPTLYQTPQTMPPQFFVEALLEYAGKKKRSARDQTGFNIAPTKPLGMWKNLSATNLGSFSSGSDYNSVYSASNPAEAPTFQQHLSSLLGKSEKRVLEEQEQVLKKLRVLIRNGSIRWTGEFIKVGGPLALLQFCNQVQKSDETKLGQRERLLHQSVQCLKAIVSLEGGVDSLVKEPVFFPLMRTLAINETPVLTPSKSKEATAGRKSKTGSGGLTSTTVNGQRSRSSSIPKPIQTRAGYQTSFQSSSSLTLDQIPTFSNSQVSVGILAAILAREPELRDQILKEVVADSNPSPNLWKGGDDWGWKYLEWIAYLKEIIQVCGIDIPSLSASSDFTEGLSQEKYMAMTSYKEAPGRGKGANASKMASMGQGLPMLGQGPSGSTLSLFSLDNMRKRMNNAATPGSASPSPMGGIKYEPGEDREVLAYLTAHLELVSKLIFDMHISGPGLAFAKSVKESQLEDYLERLRAICIQSQDLSAQIEDLVIQLSMVPSTTSHTAARLSSELPVIPPFESPSYQRHYQLQSQSMQPISPLHMQYQYQLPDAKYGAQVVPKTAISGIPSGSGSLDSLANDRHPVTNAYSNINGQYGNGVGAQRPLYGGLPRNPSQVKPNPMQYQQQQQQGGAGRTRKASVIGMVDDNYTSPSGLSRQISVKRSSTDGYREIGIGHQSPSQQDSRKSVAKNGLYREETPLPSRATSRRATVGEDVPKASFAGSSTFQVGLPVVPPKNKNRPTSMEAKGRNGNLLPRIQYTTVKLDQQEPFQQPQPIKKFSSMPITTSTTDKVEVDGAAVSRSSSVNTFGHGRRTSLSNVGNITAKSRNGVATAGFNTPSFVSSSAISLGVPSAGHDRNNLSTDGSGTSTCSSTTSSGFTSNSSVSPLSTQTKKYSMLSTSAMNVSLPNTNSNNGQGAIISTSSKLPRLNTTALPPPPRVKSPEKEVHQFRDVDFDTRIQDNVHKLASSSSKSRLRDEMDNKGMIAKLEIQVTDSRVLEAPIVVPEDMSLMRDQYIREQLSGIVLPPLERKIRANLSMEIDVDAVAKKTKATTSRRISVSSGIPMPAPSTPSPSMILQNQGSKRLFMEQPTLGLSDLVKPQLGGARPRSSTPSSATALSPLPTNGLYSGKARISDRIRLFERE